MKESNELNDIILNKGGQSSNNKKIILAVATLGVILIIVVMLMNSLTSSGTDNLPQTPLPPQVKAQDNQNMQDEPLFEEVDVMEEDSQEVENLEEITRKLKEESQAVEEVEVIEVPVIQETVIKEVKKPVVEVKPVVKAKAVVKPKTVVKNPTPVALSKNNYYIQVGSFSKYAPNKKFLTSITKLGYTFTFHKITKNSKSINKVLVGPFKSSLIAKDARRVLRAKIEPGAFLTKL